MDEYLKKLLHKLFRNFAKPDMSSTPINKLVEIDRKLNNLESHQAELKARARLLDIQSTPRGGLNG